MKELIFEEMTVRQKLSFVNAVSVGKFCTQEDEDYVLGLIRERALGAVWVQWNAQAADLIRNRIKLIRETADYPIIIMTDSECGFGEYKIGHHNALGRVGSEKSAHAFGKKLGIMAREIGYNTVCNPLLDVSYDGSSRSFGGDIHEIARLAAAEARGMHEAGVLTVGKHYPSAIRKDVVDTHLQESPCDQTAENLLETSLYAYRELMKEDLLDGIMVGHSLMVNIDPDRPACLSKPVVDVIRNCGYEGFAITDALCMMGIRAKYGDIDPMGMCIEAGCDLALMYNDYGVKSYQNALYDCYERGILTDEALDAAVKRILRAQHRVFLFDSDRATEVTEEEEYLAKNIDADGVYAKVDDGLATSISRDGKYLFVLMTSNEYKEKASEVGVDTFSGKWHNPDAIIAKINELFPRSDVRIMHQYPTQDQCYSMIIGSFGYDEIIFITYTEFLAYTGAECFTRRFLSIVSSMQYTNRISTLIHFGNPMILDEMPHIGRKILGGCSARSTFACLEVLAGEREAKGRLTYDVNFK